MENQFRGMDTILVLRSSLDELAEKSIPQQREQCYSFAEANGMRIIDEVIMPGVSATTGANEEFLQKLLQRKLKGEKFAALLFYDLGRFSRIVDDGNRLFAQFSEAEIDIVSTREGLKTGKYAWVERSLALREHEAYAEKLSDQTCRGVIASMRSGKIPHTLVTPYGVDRLYLDASNEPLFIVRCNADKSVSKLHPVTKEVLAHFPHELRRKCVIKQPSETIRFIKGADDAVSTVRSMFHWHHMLGWGHYKICQQLNDRAIASPRGGRWGVSVVRGILRNPVYVGIGYACTMTMGVHHARDRTGAKPNPTPRRPGFKLSGEGKRKHIAPRKRPKEDWLSFRYPELDDFLEESLREMVVEEHQRRIQSLTNSEPKRPTHRRYHSDTSPYILSGLLRTVHGDHPMSGWPTCGMIGKGKLNYRYYYYHGGTAKPSSSHVSKARVRADVVEDAVIKALQEVIACPETISRDIVNHIKERCKAATSSDAALKELLDEKLRVEAKYKRILLLPERGKKLFEEEAAQIEKQLIDLEGRIKLISAEMPFDGVEPGDVAVAVLKQLEDVQAVLRDRPLAALRKVLQVFVGRLTFDGITREIDLELRLPEWAISKGPRIADYIREVSGSVANTAQDTKYENAVIWGKITCRSHRVGQKPCLSCERIRPAA